MAKAPPTRPITDGARALRSYLDKAGISVPVFCEHHGLDRISVQRALNGERQRISVDFASAIEKATGGAVVWSSWQTRTAKTVALSSRARLARKAS